MERVFHVFIYISFFTISTVISNIESFDKNKYNAGKADLAYLKHEASFPKYGKCWLDALDRLEIGCDGLTEDELYKMTFSFMNCFLLKTGRGKQDCPSYSSVEDCTKMLKSEAYSVYTKFFTHTQNVCFFLQAQKWQASTRLTVNKLVDTSEVVATQMKDSNTLQSEILKRQGDSIHLQEILLEGGNVLKKTLDESKMDLDKVMADFKISSSEQKNLLFEVFDKIKTLQSLVVGEMSGFLSVVFYLASILISYLLTSAPRSSSARLLLFFIMSFNLLNERIMFKLINFDKMDVNDDQTFTLTEEEYYYYRDVSRLICTAISFLTLLWCIIKYKDFGILNNDLLKEIKEQNTIFKQKILEQLDELKKQEDDSDSLGYASYCDSDESEDLTFHLDSSVVSSTSTLDLKEDLRFICTSTPYKELLSEGLISCFNTPTKKTESSQQLLDETLTPGRKYNLRPRRTPNRQITDFEETPSEFGEKIKLLEKESHSNSRKNISSKKIS